MVAVIEFLNESCGNIMGEILETNLVTEHIMFELYPEKIFGAWLVNFSAQSWRIHS